MSSSYLYMVHMDVAHDRETVFNEIYNTEHVPALLTVLGVWHGSRYSSPSPTDFRYVAMYEVDRPDITDGPAWKAAVDFGCWPGGVRPFMLNRHVAMYERVGGAAELTYATPYIFLVMMDLELHREALFNELYDNEHLLLMLGLPGCENALRYRTEAPSEPRHMAVYGVTRPDLPNSASWNDAGNIGR